LQQMLSRDIERELRMNRKLSSILLIAFVIAATTSYVVYRVTQNQLRRSAQAAPISIPIIVAARDLEIGTLIKDIDLTTAEWVGTPPKGAVVNKDAAMGRGVVSQIYQGEPILETRLAAPGSGGGLAATIPPGMRACAVRVDDVVGVAGFVVPGMRVDVLVSGSAPGTTGNQGSKVKTLLQNIQVLSAGTNIQKDAEGKPVQVQVVNLLVTPEQAELLSLASSQTKIQLVLRNPLDTDTPKTPDFATANLFSDSPPPKPQGTTVPAAKKAPVPPPTPPPPAPAAKPPEPTIYLIQVLNGAKKSEEKFKDSEQEQPQQ
jgi:pilus assembly protein CpaB